MISNKKKYDFLVYIVCLLSIIGGVWNGQYINDGYHWGFIYSNSIDFINGKQPFKDFFLEYGFLQLLLNSLLIKMFGQKVFIIQFLVIFLYSFSFLLIYKIILNLTFNKRISFYSILILFCIFPWPISPWPVYITFNLSVLFIYFFIKDTKKNYIISSVFLFCAYLTFTTLFNFVITFYFIFSFTILFFFNFYKKYKIDIKLNIILYVFIFLLGIFFIYLIVNDYFKEWLLIQETPFIIKNSFNKTFDELFFSFIYFLYIKSFINIVYEPQWIIYSILFSLNIFYILILLKRIYFKEVNKKMISLFFISIYILSLTFVAQVMSLSYFATTISISIIFFAVFYNNLKSKDTKFIIKFIMIFLIGYSLINFDMKYSSNAEKRYHSVRHIDDEKNLRNKNFEHFVFFKWRSEYWNLLEQISNEILNIKNNCEKIIGANLTHDSYFYILIENPTIQKIPFFLTGSKFGLNSIYDTFLFDKVNIEINNENIFIISHKNNEKSLNFNEYYEFKKFYLKTDKIIDEEFRVYYPIKCN